MKAFDLVGPPAHGSRGIRLTGNSESASRRPDGKTAADMESPKPFSERQQGQHAGPDVLMFGTVTISNFQPEFEPALGRPAGKVRLEE